MIDRGFRNNVLPALVVQSELSGAPKIPRGGEFATCDSIGSPQIALEMHVGVLLRDGMAAPLAIPDDAEFISVLPGKGQLGPGKAWLSECGVSVRR